jgi:hypothetical protein
MYMIPDWIILMNTLFGLIGIFIGLSAFKQGVSIKRGVSAAFGLLIIGIVIEQIVLSICG